MPRNRGGWDRDWYPPSRPIEVEGGIKARSTRGNIAQTWWSERFISVLEGLGVRGRMERGRRYARQGQVLSLEVDAGNVRASVQGSRARPYKVQIGIDAFGKAQWASLVEALVGDAWYAAQLLAGEMPTEIEDLFAAQGLPLFPEHDGDLSMDCSCPDWEVPCKHLAATFYLLAETFDDDPFTILAWRGRDRDDLLANLRAARATYRDAPVGRADGGSDTPGAGAGPEAGAGTATSGAAVVPLEECLDSFYALQGDLPAPAYGASDSAGHELPESLPPTAIAVRDRHLPDLLAPAYTALTEAQLSDESV